MYFILNNKTGEFLTNYDGYPKMYKSYENAYKNVPSDSYSCYALYSMLMPSVNGDQLYTPTINTGLSDKDLEIIKIMRGEAE